MPRAGFGLSVLIASIATLSPASAQFASSYALDTLAGGDPVGDGGPARLALLNHLQGVAADTKGNVYIADGDDHRVRKITPGGIITTLAGNGHAGFTGDGGRAASAELRTPYGVAVDFAGNLYIADLGNARIRRVGPDGTISSFAGGGSTPAAQADGADATSVALISPRNVAVDGAGSVYFSDFGGNRVYKVSTGGMLTVVAGTGEAGFGGDGGPARNAQLSAPAGLAVTSSGTVYIADSGNGRIRRVERGLISTLGDGGRSGAAPAVPVSLPVGLALDIDGSLYVADIGGNQIVQVTPALVSTPIAQPASDVAIDSQGNLFASSGALLYRMPRLGASVVLAGGSGNTYLGDGGPALEARLNHPQGIARDAAGNVYIADTGNHRIRRITAEGSIGTVAGSGAQGFSGDSGLAVDAKLDTPTGVAVDALGNLYIADSGNQRIRKVDASGFISTIVGTGVRSYSPDGTAALYTQVDTPVWLAFDSAGQLYFSEAGNQIVRRVTATGQVQTVAGNRARGYTGDGGPATAAGLDTPQGIAFDAAGNLYIADSGNRRIRMVAAPVSPGESTISTVPDVNASTWRGVRGLAADANGSIYASDASDARVFRIDPPGQVYTIAGTSVPSFTGESGAALATGIDTPAGIAVDKAGKVYVVDSGNGRVRVLTPAYGPTANPSGSGQVVLTITNSASLQVSAIAPGELVTLFGSGLGPAAGISAVLPSVQLGGTQVIFNGRLAPLTYVRQDQINLQVPYSLGEARPCEVQVMVGGVVKARATVAVTDAAPAIFTVSSGTGQAAALNEDSSLNSAANPATRGSIIVLYATGGGQTDPAGVEGRAAGWPAPAPVLPIEVRIGDYRAEILYAAEAPGFAGLLQVNARVPGGFAPPGILPVTLQIGSSVSQAGVTVAVR